MKWTIGDVHPSGYEALRLSIWGAWKIFGREAEYAVCVNTIPVEHARRRTGRVPDKVRWHTCTETLPRFLRERLDAGMAEGAAWKFAPVHFFQDRFELALDNDCILWEMPDSIRIWLERADKRGCLVAEDVRSCFGQFSAFCGSSARNLGIRGLPPGCDWEGCLRSVLEEHPVRLVSELDEQGLQVAALTRLGPIHLVKLDQVSICSPFPPHLPGFGRDGAHFVGLNARSLPWKYYDRPAVECIQEHWRAKKQSIYEKIGSW